MLLIFRERFTASDPQTARRAPRRSTYTSESDVHHRRRVVAQRAWQDCFNKFSLGLSSIRLDGAKTIPDHC